MTDFPDTRDSLIVQIGDPQNRVAWEQFVDLYRPVIYRLARRRGMQDADANDLAQKVLLSVASAVDGWEKLHEKVRFRHWLRKVVRNAIFNALLRRPRDRALGGSSADEWLGEQLADDESPDAAIDLEYRRELYRRAAKIVQRDVAPDTWRAFELTCLDDQPIQAAAHLLGKQPGSIYAARSGVMRRLRNAVKELEQEFES